MPTPYLHLHLPLLVLVNLHLHFHIHSVHRKRHIQGKKLKITETKFVSTTFAVGLRGISINYKGHWLFWTNIQCRKYTFAPLYFRNFAVKQHKIFRSFVITMATHAKSQIIYHILKTQASGKFRRGLDSPSLRIGGKIKFTTVMTVVVVIMNKANSIIYHTSRK